MSSYRHLIQCGGFIALPHIGGFIGGMITRANIPTFYNHLKKPTWTPPTWLISTVWPTLYSGMGYASYLIWKETEGFSGEGKLPLALYGAQLALNWAWSPIFFGMHKIGLALANALLTSGAVGGCIYLFYPINKTASYLMAPYLAWLTFATALTYRIWKDNPDTKDKEA